jgi:hypothetical protein
MAVVRHETTTNYLWPWCNSSSLHGWSVSSHIRHQSFHQLHNVEGDFSEQTAWICVLKNVVLCYFLALFSFPHTVCYLQIPRSQALICKPKQQHSQKSTKSQSKELEHFRKKWSSIAERDIQTLICAHNNIIHRIHKSVDHKSKTFQKEMIKV